MMIMLPCPPLPCNSYAKYQIVRVPTLAWTRAWLARDTYNYRHTVSVCWQLYVLRANCTRE